MNKKDLNATAQKIANSANKKAKTATGWKKWFYAAAAILAAAVAFFTATGCTASYSQSAAGDISATVTIVQPSELQK